MAGDPWRTKLALDGLAAYLKSSGVDPKAYLAKTGVAATNYYGNFDDLSRAMFGSRDPEVYADPALAHSLLGWRAAHGLEAMCRDAWHWQARNPEGYRPAASGVCREPAGVPALGEA